MKHTKLSLPWLYCLLERGECEFIDFKEYLNDKIIFGKSSNSFSSSYDDMAKDVVAFSNFKGGFIIVGVNDKTKEINREFVIEKRKIYELIQNIQSRTNPSITVIPHELKVNNSVILIIEVPFSEQLHCTTKGEYLLRNNDGNRIIQPYEIATIQAEKSLIIFDQKIWKLNYEWKNRFKIDHLWNKISENNPGNGFLKKDPDEFLEVLGMTRESDEMIYPTTTGILFVGNEKSLKELPYNQIKYIRYYNDGSYTPFEYKGDIVSMVDDVFNQLKSEIKVHEIHFGLFREYIEDYPELVLRELLVNAIAHRDYSRHQIIEIRKYDDYLEIENPGIFPEGITPENCLRKTNPRNPAIMDIFKEIIYAEKAGSGLDKVFRILLAKGKELPKFEISTNSVKVRIYAAMIEKNLIEISRIYKNLKNIDIDLDKLLVINYILKNKKVTFNDLANNPYINENQLKNILEELRSLEFIETSGKTSDLFYIIHKSRLFSDTDKKNYLLSKKIDLQKQQEIILRYLDEFHEIDNAKARNLLNIGKNQSIQISRLFKKMMDKNLIYIDREPKFRNRIYKRKFIT